MRWHKAVSVSIRTSVAVAVVVANARSINSKERTAADSSQEFFQVKKEFREDGFINQLVLVKNRTANKSIYLPVTVLRIKNTKMGSRLA